MGEPLVASAVAFPRRWGRLLIAGAALGIGLQVLHSVEHLAQAAYWAGHPDDPPWIGPLGRWVHQGTMVLGLTDPEAAEAMHLAGNAVFLVGLNCLWRDACHRCAELGPRPVSLLRRAWILEALHCLEHVALTASTVIVGRAVGLSTGLGLVDPGPLLWTYRVCWHLLANLAPMVLIGAAVLSFSAGRPEPDAASAPSSVRRRRTGLLRAGVGGPGAPGTSDP